MGELQMMRRRRREGHFVSQPIQSQVSVGAPDVGEGRVQEETVGPHSVIGEAAHGGVGNVVANLWARAGGGPASVKLEAFALGERGALLHHLDQAALLPHVAESEGKRFPFEVRALLCTLPASSACVTPCFQA